MCELAIAEFPDYFLVTILVLSIKDYIHRRALPLINADYRVLNRFDQMAATCVRNVVSEFQERGLIMIT